MIVRSIVGLEMPNELNLRHEVCITCKSERGKDVPHMYFVVTPRKCRAEACGLVA